MSDHPTDWRERLTALDRTPRPQGQWAETLWDDIWPRWFEDVVPDPRFL